MSSFNKVGNIDSAFHVACSKFLCCPGFINRKKVNGQVRGYITMNGAAFFQNNVQTLFLSKNLQPTHCSYLVSEILLL